MAKSTIYAGLEIGTSKICVVVGEVKKDGAIKILGVGQAPARGIRKGEITDFDIAQTCLNDALLRAEDRSDVMIRNVFLGVSGTHIESLNHAGVYRLPSDQNTITEDDLEDVREIACNVDIAQNHVFLHRIARKYSVDGQEQVRSLIGRPAEKLEAEFHIIHGVRSRVQNSIRLVRQIPLEVEDVVFLPLAAAQVVLNKEAKQHGALMIDFGGGTADYVLYIDGMLTASGCVPLGGDHITNDISLCFQIPHGRAERLKVEEGSAVYEDVAPGEMIRVEDENGMFVGEVERALLNEVISLRTQEILGQIRDRCEEHVGRLGAGVYLTGGVSMMRGIEHVAKEIFGVRVTRAGSSQMGGVTATYENPCYSAPIGLIRYAQLMDAEKPWLSPLAKLGRRMAEVFSTWTI
ncbi:MULTISPECIES: cell division protein FtsA [Verrucomicrobium]|jgi:cell division protein FtsA|uniref:cell division protein FtsA n=2 Tax=Verrucomicrobiaceae TaxID=203557 RepID=UPI00017458C6|nr:MULTISPECIES: cell division protein FtsA [Verrucomicrobium]